MNQFWNLIRETFNHEPFYCGLYSKNRPAIKFIERQGGILINELASIRGVVYKVGV